MKQAQQARIWITTVDQSQRLAPGATLHFAALDPGSGTEAGLNPGAITESRPESRLESKSELRPESRPGQNPIELGGEGVGVGAGGYNIRVDSAKRFQTMDGFGASLTDAAAYLIGHKLSPEARRELMEKCFDPDRGIGISFLRQPMGASDYAAKIYSYDDVPEGGEDFDLNVFSIEHDRRYILPLLKEALAINPQLKIMATPWSPPGWMKTSGSMIGGRLREECYAAYARYFVKFIQAYKAEGVPIYAVSPQNEPGYEPKEYPGMIFTPQEELKFIRDHLGPAFEREGLDTLILCYDHNWDVPQHPLTVLGDEAAAKYIAGTAWHVYGGTSDAMSGVHEAFPEKGTWFTEASGGSWIPAVREAFLEQMKHVVRTTRNWAKSVIWWNLALDEHNGPTVLSRSTCRGLVLIDSAEAREARPPVYNLDYDTMGHISKFVKPGARRIESDTYPDEMESTAFLNPDGSTVLIISSRTAEAKPVVVEADGAALRLEVPGEAAVTLCWQSSAD